MGKKSKVYELVTKTEINKKELNALFEAALSQKSKKETARELANRLVDRLMEGEELNEK